MSPMRHCLLLAFPLLLAAGAPKPLKLDKEGFRITVPPAWQERPEVVEQVTAQLPKNVTANAVAYGHFEQGTLMQVMWLQGHDEAKDIRAELEGFQDAMKSTVEASGGKTKRFDVAEAENRLTAHFEFENATPDGTVSVAMIATAAIGAKDSRTRSWSAQCAWMTPEGKADCDKVLASFTVTVPAKQFKAIPPKAKPATKKS